MARVTGVEVTSGIARRLRAGTILPADAVNALAQFHRDFAHQYHLIEVSPAVVARAMTVAENHALRAYDALQLGAVLEINGLRAGLSIPPLTLISADDELNAAALKEGLVVENPNNHP